MIYDFTIHAGWMIDGMNKPVIEDVYINIKDGYIETITGKAEEKSTVIDLSSYTLIPGLIDSHVHLSWFGTNNPEIRKRQFNQDYEKSRINIKNNLEKHLKYGIIAVRDGGDRGAHTLKFKNKNNSQIHISSPGYAVYKLGRYGGIIGKPIDKPEAINSLIKNLSGIDHIKIVNSGLNSLENYGVQTPPQFDIDELTSIIRIAKKQRLDSMVHVNGEIPVKETIEAGCTSIEHGFFMGPDNLKRMADKKVYWVPTAVTMKAYAKYAEKSSLKAEVAGRNLNHQIEQISRARESGVEIVIGTDAGGMGIEHGESVIEEMEIFLKAGFSIPEIIHCATGRSAELLHLSDCGKIFPGMKANMICIPSEPGNLIKTLKEEVRVFIKGKEINR
ncbi:MAG: amidohydrolase family protein [Spirochaetes bacterium]|nr:amidohydrolase family protein [Spirochaetota bacterium]